MGYEELEAMHKKHREQPAVPSAQQRETAHKENKMIPTIGRIVHYKINQDQAHQINRRRTDGASIASRMKAEPPQWPGGAQAHVGNNAQAGDVFPMLITKVWGSNETSAVNGQLFLDGNDVLWITSATAGDQECQFAWPQRA